MLTSRWMGCGKRRLSSALLSLKLAEQALRSDQVVVEDAPRHGEQLADQRIANDVADARAFFAAGDNVFGSQHRQLLRNYRLIDVQNLLQLLNASITLKQQLQDLDSNWVGERSEEFRFEALELASR